MHLSPTYLSTLKICRVELCTELLYAIIPTLFLCFLLICISLHFQCFFILVLYCDVTDVTATIAVVSAKLYSTLHFICSCIVGKKGSQDALVYAPVICMFGSLPPILLYLQVQRTQQDTLVTILIILIHWLTYSWKGWCPGNGDINSAFRILRYKQQFLCNKFFSHKSDGVGRWS